MSPSKKLNYKIWANIEDVVNDCIGDTLATQSFVRKWETDDSISFIVNAEETTSPKYEVSTSFVPDAIASNISDTFPWLKMKKHKHLFSVEGVIENTNALLYLYQHTSQISTSNEQVGL